MPHHDNGLQRRVQATVSEMLQQGIERGEGTDRRRLAGGFSAFPAILRPGQRLRRQRESVQIRSYQELRRNHHSTVSEIACLCEHLLPGRIISIGVSERAVDDDQHLRHVGRRRFDRMIRVDGQLTHPLGRIKKQALIRNLLDWLIEPLVLGSRIG